MRNDIHAAAVVAGMEYVIGLCESSEELGSRGACDMAIVGAGRNFDSRLADWIQNSNSNGGWAL